MHFLTTPPPLVMNNGAPQDCVLSSLLLILYTHACIHKHEENLIANCAEDSVIGKMSNDNESSRPEENKHSRQVVRRHQSTEIKKSRVLIVDLLKKEDTHPCLHQ